MASVSVPSSGTGIILALGPVGGPGGPSLDGPAHILVGPTNPAGPPSGPRCKHDLVGLPLSALVGLAVGDAVTYTDDGTDITVTKI